MDTAKLYQLFQKHPSISTDTRNILPGSIFFALKGTTFNGNQFAEKALSLGASFAVVDEPVLAENDKVLLVSDVLETLQNLARYHRDQLGIPLIGITGTNGKTTTKELLHAVLSQKFNTYATKGNLNNHIGVPLSILSIKPDVEVAIIEMGANHIGEIAFLCSIAKPGLGLITNVGKAHLEGFGSFEGVKQAKGELYVWLEAHKGVLFLQGDNSHLLAMANNKTFKEIITYGMNKANSVSGELLAVNPVLTLRWDSFKAYGCENQSVFTHLTGSYNLENVLAAVAVGLYFGLKPDEINKGIEAYKPSNNRSQITETGKNTVICDYYNANASSMSAALDNLESLDAGEKAVILGDMFELGEEAPQEHRRLIERVNAMPLNRKIFVGKNFFEQKQAGGDDMEYYENLDAAKEALQSHPLVNSTVLLKASRGMAFERLLVLL
ncbi:UDP-N-acetylmuramoyl-tripeptide--D-alanyl-D-alanine ligase [Olivibacter sp. XZL3]|uniref:UDP-N-acetylmuramoyl-tripeptide--D-alanyl-D- alanine ligase n=1 Tax=Olivibacter sp. XZL3 TaxID=1735116 RepID=UPI001065D9B1|nr:UDP-N-acetylmuramoyl-tripeptide--D-alanyl-D-alanine ligase [Olivibacter sp. XZL3]